MKIKIRKVSPALFVNNKLSGNLQRIYQDNDYALWRRDNYFKPKYYQNSEKGPTYYAQSLRGIEIFRIGVEDCDFVEHFIEWVESKKELLFDYCLLQEEL
jgi:hypothetical protein